jgi:ferredoxin
MALEPAKRLVVDWVRCDGQGVCSELLPELVQQDDWGYPVVRGLVPRRLEKLAERARASCPSLALRLAKADDAPR